ncbi:2,3-bisphosphoglycerate-independent phosphoglycerate mutase [Dehalobacterium formicoaceticum]|uniref:2,3-bisphosphoglycerate-independent phosphoglycerate mutase n=1 Tax=Dehalobacterium formicoaceticum TaxID=51515 RepID=A0ABT1Y2R5_9FIRM|nr:2,3-bisphosphoglycerate-independent phosphoglycerate mutase [Dehalobacterium formicoaceticum]
MFTKKKPLILMILDGWGSCEQVEGNAIMCAWLPNYQHLLSTYPHTLLKASGEAVGLPEGQMGNSEVGHLTIGAGRVVFQELTRIHRAIRDQSFRENHVLLEAFHMAQERGSRVHLMGLLSDGGVHSHINHLIAILEMAAELGVKEVYLHCFLDGRDVSPTSGKEYLAEIQEKMAALGVGTIATMMGRFYAMDRDQRWDRVAKAYQAMVYGEGIRAVSPQAALEQSYEQRVNDEFVEPVVFVDEQGRPKGRIQSGDTVIFYNFRADRAREITRAFIEPEFSAFDRGTNPPQVHYVCMTQYHHEFQVPVVFPPQNLDHTLGQVLAEEGLKQLRIAETEKYAHVTFFFNGGVEEANPGEDRILIPSPHIATYDLKPEMSAYEVTEKVVEKIKSGIYDVIIINYANPDMVGHTGMMDATVKAVETVDVCLGKVVEAVRNQGGRLLITADHGNAEAMIDINTGGPQTAHTSDEVPFILVDDELIGLELKEKGALSDIAPTMLELIGIRQPEEMTGKSLLK